jgi:hypothetical protein
MNLNESILLSLAGAFFVCVCQCVTADFFLDTESQALRFAPSFVLVTP